MSDRRTRVATTLLALLAGTSVATAADYYSYQYNEIQVLAQGSAAYTRSIARQIDTLDLTLQKLLSRDVSAAQPPTRIYALQPEDFASVDAGWAQAGGAFFRFGPFEHVLVIPSENEAPNPKRELYAARARAWLDDQGLAWLPDWYKHGFGLVVAAATIDNDKLLLGQEMPVYTAALNSNRWLPTDVVMTTASADERFQRSDATRLQYDAQCWWLTRLSLFDAEFEKIMTPYLIRLRQGQNAAEQLTPSFVMSPESLEKLLKKLHRAATIRPVALPVPPIDTDTVPAPVDAVELKARLAQLAWMHDPESAVSKQWISEVLEQSPDNERALLVRMENQLTAREFGPLLMTVARLKGNPSLTAAGYRSVAVAEIAMAKLRDSGVQALTGQDAHALRAAARVQLRRSAELDNTHPLPIYALGWLLASQGDVATVKQVLPEVEQVFRRRPYSAELANLLVRLHTLAGNKDEEFKYAVVARRLADNDFDRLVAHRRIERLQQAMKQSLAR